MNEKFERGTGAESETERLLRSADAASTPADAPLTMRAQADLTRIMNDELAARPARRSRTGLAAAVAGGLVAAALAGGSVVAVTAGGSGPAFDLADAATLLAANDPTGDEVPGSKIIALADLAMLTDWATDIVGVEVLRVDDVETVGGAPYSIATVRVLGSEKGAEAGDEIAIALREDWGTEEALMSEWFADVPLEVGSQYALFLTTFDEGSELRIPFGMSQGVFGADGVSLGGGFLEPLSADHLAALGL